LPGTLYLHPDSVSAVYDEIKDRIASAWGPEARDERMFA
jgi:hypothetical protein